MKLTDEQAFSKLLVAIEPWLDQVVIVGGCAHRLYRLHPDAQGVGYPPLATLDTDIAMPEKLPVRQTDLRQRLLASGFREEFLGDDQPLATHYHLGEEGAGFYAEFLAPLTGSEYAGGGTRQSLWRASRLSACVTSSYCWRRLGEWIWR